MFVKQKLCQGISGLGKKWITNKKQIIPWSRKQYIFWRLLKLCPFMGVSRLRHLDLMCLPPNEFSIPYNFSFTPQGENGHQRKPWPLYTVLPRVSDFSSYLNSKESRILLFLLQQFLNVKCFLRDYSRFEYL